MRFLLTFLFIIMLSNCAKHKTVMICGDHVCINKLEAKQYFEENLSIEVKILNQNESTYIPLGAKHRLSNPGDKPLIIIEVQSTKCLVCHGEMCAAGV